MKKILKPNKKSLRMTYSYKKSQKEALLMYKQFKTTVNRDTNSCKNTKIRKKNENYSLNKEKTNYLGKVANKYARKWKLKALK